MRRRVVAVGIKRATRLRGRLTPDAVPAPHRGVLWCAIYRRTPAKSGARGAAVGERDDRMRRVESILFLAREPLPSRKVSQYANLADATEARTLIRRLNELYDARGRAFRVEEVAGGYQLLTRPQFARWLRRLGQVPHETRLSAPALETLAVVAYRQPIGRAAIEAIRGVSCGEILRQLIERDLVRITGRSDELGRPYLYGTTRVFLQLFGLKSLDDLPGAVLKDRLADARSRQDTSSVIPEKAYAGRDCKNEEEPDVSTTFVPVLPADELLDSGLTGVATSDPRCADDDEADGGFEDEEEDEEEDDFEDEDEEDDFEDEEYDEEEDFDEEEEEFEDEEFEDEEWEEVEDEDDEEEWEDDDEDLDWEDDDEEEDGGDEEETDDKWD